ncbi:MAG: oligosaccharide flippase family protein, partial [Candidatus Goldbacteria bacterium]|nr:oligosaccharide flippase family protein [Candidatus Goldiibacteriota bacterium]
MIDNESGGNFKFINEPLKERLKKNSITNILYFILTLPLLFFLTPLILKYVGKEVYGIWVLTGTILIFIEIFANMQMSSSVSILVPKFDPKKEEKDINEICNTLIVFYFVISVIIGILYLFLKNNIVSIFFKVDKQNIETTHFILTVSIYFFLINFIITGFAYLMGGFNIFYVNNILHIIISYIRAALMVFVLFTGYGIKGIVIVQMTTTLFESIILAFFTKMVFPPLRISFKYFSLTKLKIMLGISIKLLFSRIAIQINNNIDKLILGYFLNPVIIAYYQLGSAIAKYIT